MSLTVRAYRYNAQGEMEFLKVPLGKNLAGFESSRENFWGADVMTSLGLTLLPSLKEKNVRAEGNTLNELEREVHIIQQNVELILQNVDYNKLFVDERTDNILDAIRIARENNGGVVIW